MLERTQESLCQFYRVLYDLKKEQKLKEGENGEILEYTKAIWSVELPDPKITYPREKPIPKPKPMTKWERFRIEKGLPAKEKRSRMVFDPITKDWVPRYGMGSIKKIEEKYIWLMEENPKQVEAGTDPFTYKKQQKKLEKEKQDLRELKNRIVSSGPAGTGKTGDGSKAAFEQILDSSAKDAPVKTESKEVTRPNLKTRDDVDRERIRKRERKALMKSLQLAQVSTASMGKFDKKLKSEPDAPNSQTIKKKKSSKKLYEIESNKDAEKQRNLKIFGLL